MFCRLLITPGLAEGGNKTRRILTPVFLGLNLRALRVNFLHLVLTLEGESDVVNLDYTLKLTLRMSLIDLQLQA